MLKQISASAGSGKTYTLTETFLEYLEKASLELAPGGCPYKVSRSDYSLSEVMAATFTNKAAAEMKERILSALKSKALKAHKKSSSDYSNSIYDHWLKKIFHHSALLNVRTIDSLLNMLVRLSALQLSLPPDFELSFDEKKYFTPVYEDLMADLNSYNRGEFCENIAPHRAEKCIIALNDFFISQIKYSKFLGFHPGEKLHDHLFRVIEIMLLGRDVPVMDKRLIHAQIESLHLVLKNQAIKMQEVLQEEKLVANKNFLNFLPRLIMMSSHEEPPFSTYIEKDELDDILNKNSKGKASFDAKSTYSELTLIYKTFVQDQKILKKALPLVPLTPLAHIIYEGIEKNLKETGLLPAIALPRLAESLLLEENGVSDALCRVGTSLRHLLLDEFQDTSREQWHAILPLGKECLANGGTITYVGDVKQAIYSWRGGDSKLFYEIAQDPELTDLLEDKDNKDKPLVANWRSSPAIINHNNAFFGMLADEEITHKVLVEMLSTEIKYNRISEEGLEEARTRLQKVFSNTFQELPPKDKNPTNIHKEGLIKHYIIDGEDVGDLNEKVEREVSHLIIDLCKRWKYRDIAILIRSGTEASAVASWLAKLNIPVVTENSFLLADNPVISRLIALLSFVDYPYNDIAFWEFVTGDEIFGKQTGLKREFLDKWLAGKRQGLKPLSGIFQIFQKDFPEIWSRWIAPFHNKAGLMSAYDMVHEAIRIYDLYELNPDDTAFLKRLLELAQAAESNGKTTLAAFLDFWKDCSEDEKIPLPENMDAVRIMTMHKAKGLEFPVVVLPFQHSGQGNNFKLTKFDYAGIPILTEVCPETPDEYLEMTITETIERLNILYVAWTRPVNELHSFITSAATYPTPMSKGLKVLLEEFEQHNQGLCTIRDISTVGKDTDSTEDYDPVGDDIPLQLDIIEPSNGLETETTLLESSSKASPQNQNNDAPKLMDWLPRLKIFRTTLSNLMLGPEQLGTLTHLCLENLYLPENLHDSEQVKLSVDKAINQGLKKIPQAVYNKEKIIPRLKESLMTFLAIPNAVFWLENGLREQSIFDEKGNKYIVDLLVDEGTNYRAIDYKTGREYADQYSRQIKNYMQIFSQAVNKPVLGTIIYLDSAEIVDIKEV